MVTFSLKAVHVCSEKDYSLILTWSEFVHFLSQLQPANTATLIAPGGQGHLGTKKGGCIHRLSQLQSTRIAQVILISDAFSEMDLYSQKDEGFPEFSIEVAQKSWFIMYDCLPHCSCSASGFSLSQCSKEIVYLTTIAVDARDSVISRLALNMCYASLDNCLINLECSALLNIRKGISFYNREVPYSPLYCMYDNKYQKRQNRFQNIFQRTWQLCSSNRLLFVV